jgi:hypothetical protein
MRKAEPTYEDKVAESKEMSADIEAFLAKGGKMKVIEIGVSNTKEKSAKERNSDKYVKAVEDGNLRKRIQPKV